jgi:hypothetical protein
MTRTTAGYISFIVIVFLTLSLLLISPSNAIGQKFTIPNECPYQILGIKKSDRNNFNKIKKAYRQKAKDLHPDKNLDLDEKIANDNFHRLVNAWELLSNASNKIRYDNYIKNAKRQQPNQGRSFRAGFNGGSTTSQQQQQQQQQKYKQQQEAQRTKKEEMEKRAKIIKEATMARQQVLKILTLEQLQETLLDRNMQFKKYFFCVFVADKNIENFVDNELLFPYPFIGGKEGRNSFDWEPILHTVKVRYNQQTPLTRAFRVPTVQAAKRSSRPYIVFAKKGDTIDQFQIYKPKVWSLRPYQNLESWIMSQLMTTVTVVNHHHTDIRIFPVKDDKEGVNGIGKIIRPGQKATILVSIADRIVALDGNIDNFPGSSPMKNRHHIILKQDKLDRVTMGSVVVKESKQTINFGTGYETTRQCYDLSFTCEYFAADHSFKKGQSRLCEAQYEFAHTMCPYSCGVCIDSQWNGLYYNLFHLPLQKVPTPFLRGYVSILRSSSKFAHVFLVDLSHLWSMRRNVICIFFFLAFLAGIQSIIFARMILNGIHVRNTSRPFDNLGLILSLTISMAVLGVWMSHSTTGQVHSALRGFNADLRFMVRHTMDIVYGLLCLGILSVIVSKKLAQKLHRRQPELRRINQASFVVFSILLSTLMVMGTTHFLLNDMPLYTHVWNFRKNVAVAIIVLGNMLGASLLGVGQFVIHFFIQSKGYLQLSVINVSIGCCAIGFAIKDRFFLKDLHHVLDMRMSAAIPCAVMGMMFGMSLAYFFSNYQVKMKLD